MKKYLIWSPTRISRPGSVLGPLLFLIYINDLNRAITYSYISHFADDTSILYRDKSLRKINQRINHDLKNIVEWVLLHFRIPPPTIFY